MRVAVFGTKAYDRRFLTEANAAFGHDLRFLEARLEPATVALAQGCDAICVFVNDSVDAAVLEALAAGGIRLIALRCAGFNNVDLAA
ncbi:MAG: 2-hydroxyacid dehydrogenase, partial [Sphingomonadales bacterium]